MSNNFKNPRYLAYCKHFGNTPEEQMAKDTERWKGGPMTGYILFMKEKWRQFWLLDKWPEVEGHFSHAFDVWLEQTLASEKEAKIKNPEDELTDLLETVAKIGCFFGAADNSCGDRAKDISEIIAWAKEFQSINAGRVWDGEWEDELRVFFKSKVSPEIDDDFLANF